MNLILRISSRLPRVQQMKVLEMSLICKRLIMKSKKKGQILFSSIQAKRTLRKLVHYLILKTPNLDFSNLPKKSLLDDLNIKFKKAYSDSIDAQESPEIT